MLYFVPRRPLVLALSERLALGASAVALNRNKTKNQINFPYLVFMNNDTAKSSNSKSIISIVVVGCILISLSVFGINYSKSKAIHDKAEERRNTKICQDLYKDTYEGVIVKAKKNHLRIRRLNGKKYQEFNYLFDKSYKVNDHFYAGQKISKQAKTEFFTAELHGGRKKVFNIPCWE